MTTAEIKTSIQAKLNEVTELLNLLEASEGMGIDNVLVQNQPLTEDRNIDLNGKKLSIGGVEFIGAGQIGTSVINTTAGGGIVLEAPNSNRYLVHIDDNGQLLFTNI